LAFPLYFELEASLIINYVWMVSCETTKLYAVATLGNISTTLASALPFFFQMRYSVAPRGRLGVQIYLILTMQQN